VQNNNQVGPNYSRFTVLGALAGITICLALVVIADITDTTIHSEEFLSATYSDFPLLAVIPSLDDKDSRYSGYASSRTGKTQGGAK
jgi:capsular polysaccharide biosynthesis protein